MMGQETLGTSSFRNRMTDLLSLFESAAAIDTIQSILLHQYRSTDHALFHSPDSARVEKNRSPIEKTNSFIFG